MRFLHKMKSISNCFCNCHDIGIGYCSKCSKQHDNEKTINEKRIEKVIAYRKKNKRKRL